MLHLAIENPDDRTTTTTDVEIATTIETETGTGTATEIEIENEIETETAIVSENETEIDPGITNVETGIEMRENIALLPEKTAAIRDTKVTPQDIETRRL